jgi:hypothetical protein
MTYRAKEIGSFFCMLKNLTHLVVAPVMGKSNDDQTMPVR